MKLSTVFIFVKAPNVRTNISISYQKRNLLRLKNTTRFVVTLEDTMLLFMVADK